MAFLPALGGILSGTGSIFGATGQAKAQREQIEAQKAMSKADLAERKRQFDILQPFREKQFGAQESARGAERAAYESRLGRAGQQFAGGEEAFLGSVDQPSAGVEALQQNILESQQPGIEAANRQLQAQLAQQGVRGGQAVTQARRGTGELMQQSLRDISGVQAQDTLTREAEKRAYLRQKAALGQRGTLS